MTRVVVGMALLLATFFAQACGHKREEYVPKTVVVLFDMSGSTRDDSTRRFYADVFGHVTRILRLGDAVVAGWITENSAAELDLPINKELPAHQRTGRSLHDKAANSRLDRETREFVQEVQKMMADKLGTQEDLVRNTDILGSLDQASRAFRAYRRERRELIIVSDMVHDMPDLNFEREDLSPEGARAIVERMRSEERVPDFAGVGVWCVGARHRDDRRARSIRDFWQVFFQTAGAELRDYGPTLLKLDP